MKKEENGYDLAKEVLNNIKRSKNNEISFKDMVRVISFWGFNEQGIGDIGFVCLHAREKLKKTFERALVYGDYRMYSQMIKYIETERSNHDD